MGSAILSSLFTQLCARKDYYVPLWLAHSSGGFPGVKPLQNSRDRRQPRGKRGRQVDHRKPSEVPLVVYPRSRPTGCKLVHIRLGLTRPRLGCRPRIGTRHRAIPPAADRQCLEPRAPKTS